MAQTNTLTKEKEEKICPPCGQMAGDIEETGGGCAACSGKMKDRSDKEKKDLVNRLSRLEGQSTGVKENVKNGNDEVIDELVETIQKLMK